jgi:hypothetical protein
VILVQAAVLPVFLAVLAVQWLRIGLARLVAVAVLTWTFPDTR